jgi:hypothetical protein
VYLGPTPTAVIHPTLPPLLAWTLAPRFINTTISSDWRIKVITNSILHSDFRKYRKDQINRNAQTYHRFRRPRRHGLRHGRQPGARRISRRRLRRLPCLGAAIPVSGRNSRLVASGVGRGKGLLHLHGRLGAAGPVCSFRGGRRCTMYVTSIQIYHEEQS